MSSNLRARKALLMSNAILPTVNRLSVVTSDSAALAVLHEHIDHTLTVADKALADQINGVIVPLATANGSKTPAMTRFIHYHNRTAKAVGLPKSDKALVNALPLRQRVILALLRMKVAHELVKFASQAIESGRPKSHNVAYEIASHEIEEFATFLEEARDEFLISLFNVHFSNGAGK
ncbi:hypothetical protein CCP4SC76_5850015 [Gammaproteobacteria bacterium]